MKKGEKRQNERSRESTRAAASRGKQRSVNEVANVEPPRRLGNATRMRTTQSPTQLVVTKTPECVFVFTSHSVGGKMFDIEAFIEAVKERPALYDAFHRNYNKKNARGRLWAEIGQIMYPEWGNFDVREKTEKVSAMQKKWKSLKDCFNREIRMQKNGISRKYRKKYEFYDRLTFLLKTQTSEPKPSQVRIKLENPEIRLPVQVEIPPSPSPPPPEGNPRKRKTNDGEDLPTGKRISCSRENEEDDSDRLFLMSFLSDLRVLPMSTKYWVRMMFSQIMHRAAKSLDGSHGLDYEQEVGNPDDCYLDGYTDDPSSTENC